MLYAYQCSCGFETEAVNKIADRHTHAPVCGRNATHGQMGLKLTPPMFHVATDVHYICPMTRREVTSHRQRQNIMRERNVVDANDFKPEQGFAKAEKEKAKDMDLIRQLKKDLTTGSDRPMSEKELHQLIPQMEHV